MNVTAIEDLRNFPADQNRFKDPASLREALIQGGDEPQIVEQYAVLPGVSRTLSSDLSLDTLLPNLVEVHHTNATRGGSHPVSSRPTNEMMSSFHWSGAGKMSRRSNFRPRPTLLQPCSAIKRC